MKHLRSRFGGSYLRFEDSRPLPVEEWELDTGEVKLTGLLWDGPGPTLVLLHGLNNNAWGWARVAGLLREDFRIVSVSLRGHGRSSAPETGYSLRQTTRDLEAVFHRFASGGAHVAGHSWGGKVASHFAATHPELVRSLVLADPVPPGGLNAVLRMLPGLVRHSMRLERGPFVTRQAWIDGASSVLFLGAWDDIDRRLWETSFDEQPDGAMRHHLPESAHEEILREAIGGDIREQMSGIACEVLVLRPTLTISFFPGETRAMQRGLRSVRMGRIAGDHTFIHTNPVDTAKAMRGFIGPLPSPLPGREGA